MCVCVCVCVYNRIIMHTRSPSLEVSNDLDNRP